MPRVSVVQNKIRAIEGFNAIICHPGGKDVHDGMMLPKQYPYKNMAKNNWTLDQWKRNRFNHFLPGYEVQVKDANDKVKRGNAKLANIRDTYSD